MVKKTTKPSVVLAFPGTGKSTAAKQLPGVIDLDFGFFRSAFKVRKEDEATLLEPYSKMVLQFVNSGFTVLINEPKVVPYLLQKHINVQVVVPEQDTIGEVASRVKARGGVGDRAFAAAMLKSGLSWVADWLKTAISHNLSFIELRTGQFLLDVLKEMLK